MPKSLYLDTVVLNAALRNIPFTPPATVYVALFTTAPTSGGGGVEVSGGGYTRQPAPFAAPVGQVCASSADVVFPLASSPYGTVVAFALFDAPTGGNMLYFANLSSPRTIGINDQLRFPAGQLVATES
jgi:hypothetical protein